MNKPTNKLFCIQCRDLDSDTCGSFVYDENVPFRAISPVFPDLLQLYQWMMERGFTTGLLVDFRVYEKD